MLTKQKIAEIIEHIKNKANPKAMYMFGSYAYGQPHEDSDLDLLVVNAKVINKRKELYNMVKDLISPDYSLDVLLLSEEEFNNKKNEGWLVMKEILEKGISLNVK
ncbi:MAG: hypothetical protein A2Y40_00900 [Candidatus Margulisbacteria bacterium GWF2_35_9]|nr:MAG: hypothetical protein A2Y40_00900 [Candidatus Margulisbacteria bacterium GWF2_35_9]